MVKIDLKEQVFMVFDVESVGLHGPAFAVGWVLKHISGLEIENNCLAVDLRDIYDQNKSRFPAEQFQKSLDWCVQNVKLDTDDGNQVGYLKDIRDVRATFWREYQDYKRRWPNLLLAADVPWPVEANFLSQCIRDNLLEREWEGPYPIIDIASVLAARGYDPLQYFDRMMDELPEHNPLADARQSARLLVNFLNL
jgi:hypothetical protein